ncbi:MAG: DUF4382 domain-containing protein [Desulfobacterales bacterium]|nr:DUF4382 domain-containing protein [Desulfobacterales bacterium]
MTSKCRVYSNFIIAVIVFLSIGAMPALADYTIDIELAPGENIISLPVMPVNPDIAAVTASIQGQFDSIWSYQRGKWKSYKPDSSEFSDLKTMEPGYAYRIEMNMAGILSVIGSSIDIADSGIHLSAGQNYVGFTGTSEMEIKTALSSIDGFYASVFAFEKGVLKEYNPDDTASSDLFVMKPGMGYMIQTVGECVWKLPKQEKGRFQVFLKTGSAKSARRSGRTAPKDKEDVGKDKDKENNGNSGKKDGGDVTEIWLDVQQVRVKDQSGGWQTVGAPVRFDLLESENEITQLADISLPQGTIKELRLVLGENNEVRADGELYPLKVPSGQQSGLKFKGDWGVEGCKLTKIVIDFDLDKNLNYNQGQGYMLKPVIRVVSVDISESCNTGEGATLKIGDELLVVVFDGAIDDPSVLWAEAITGIGTNLSGTYELGPDDTEFSIPAIIALRYNPGTIPQGYTENDLIVLQDGIGIPSWVNTENYTVSAYINHFSEYKVGLKRKGNIPLAGDYDGDGSDDPVVWVDYFSDTEFPRFYIKPSSNDCPDGWETHDWLGEIGCSRQLGLPKEGDIPLAGDYDGDGATDPAVWRKIGQEGFPTFYIRPSKKNVDGQFNCPDGWEKHEWNDGIGCSKQLGLAGDIPVYGDYDGDDTTDPAVWRKTGLEGFPMFFIRPSKGTCPNGWTTYDWNGVGCAKQLGLPDTSDIPVSSGDYDGDGATDPAVWREIGLEGFPMFFIRPSNNEKCPDGWTTYDWDGIGCSRQLGLFDAGDTPLSGGDYDGDGKSDPAVWRESGFDGDLSMFFIRPSTAQCPAGWESYVWNDGIGCGRQLGLSDNAQGLSCDQQSDIPISGDYQGDSITDPTVWRKCDPEGPQFYMIPSNNQLSPGWNDYYGEILKKQLGSPETCKQNDPEIPHISPEENASLKLTEQSLENLKAEGVPEYIIAELKALKNQGDNSVNVLLYIVPEWNKMYIYVPGEFTQQQAWDEAKRWGGYPVVFNTMEEHSRVVNEFNYKTIAPCHTGHYQRSDGQEPNGGWTTYTKESTPPLDVVFNSDGPDDGIHGSFGFECSYNSNRNEDDTAEGEDDTTDYSLPPIICYPTFGDSKPKNEDAGVIWHDNNGKLEDVSVNHKGSVVVEIGGVSDNDDGNSQNKWIFPAIDLHHNIGRTDNACGSNEGWSANTSDDSKGYMTYGPYINSIPEGEYRVYFKLMVDNNSADNLVVATIEIYDFTADIILKKKEIRREEFNAPFKEQTFSLSYDHKYGHKYEFRTLFHKTSYVCQKNVVLIAN